MRRAAAAEAFRHFGREQPVHMGLEQAQPAPEMLGRDALQRHVLAVHIALEFAARQHHGRPEVDHARQVRLPVGADGGVEHGTERAVAADVGIEVVDQGGDRIAVELGVHDVGEWRRKLQTAFWQIPPCRAARKKLARFLSLRYALGKLYEAAVHKGGQ
ncbi:hypothetical protein [Massilia sp. Se16.2.3]|uniref:hypothetical protein n=1 Tax=Massilia sp. Se16.2.3 TaxID=2709303 RepID=UPI0016018BAA|nr:hypothetical protein [Massilia sp. Se16.2.3]QNB00168.1 hypothetical protein G4G31_17320 [Massilia sp. Se16.2.3]